MLRIAFISVAISGLVVMTGAALPPPSAEGPVVVSPHVLEQLDARGHARVIVGLAGAFTPEGMLQARDRAQQRAAIAAAQERVLARLEDLPVETVKRFRFTPAVAMEVDADGLRAIAASPDVAYVEEDRVDFPLLAETRTITGAITAFENGYRGAGTTIAVLDTGLDYRDPYFGGGGFTDDASPGSRVVSEACYSTSSAGTVSACLNGTTGRGAARPYGWPGFEHGTDVAGIIAGENSATTSSPEGHGMAPAATIIAVQVFSVSMHEGCRMFGVECPVSFVSDQILGLERVYELRTTFNIAAVNLSVGIGWPNYTTQAECDAANPSRGAIISTLRSAGIATIIGSGNFELANAISAPACLSGAISVGATNDGSIDYANPIDSIARFSNSATFLELLAPGQVVTVRGRTVRGTSYAAAHVTGAWALVKAEDPALTVQEVLDTFKTSGTPVLDTRNGVSTPRINVAAALELPVTSSCTYRISHREALARQVGDTIDIAMDTQPGCVWSAWSAVRFATVGPVFGVGPRVVSISVSTNDTDQRRIGLVYVNGQPFIFFQAGTRPWAKPFDVNHDGRMDLLWQHQTTGDLAAWVMDGATQVAGTALTPSQVGDTDWKIAGAGDLDGDGSDDLVWQHIGDGRVAAWFMSALTLRSGELLSIPQVNDLQWRIGAVGDVDGDGRADLVWRHEGDGRLAIWLMSHALVLSAFELRDAYNGIMIEPDPNWRLVGVTDFTGITGYTEAGTASRDLLWHHQVTGQVRVWIFRGSDLVEERLIVPSVPEIAWQIRALGDLNGDSHPDLIWQHTADGRVAVWLMNGLTLVEGRLLTPPQVADTNWHIVGPR